MMAICLKLLEDSAFAVREAGCKLITKLMLIFKSQEFGKGVDTKLTELLKNPNYLMRNSILILLREFSNEPKLLDFLETNLLRTLVSLVKDPISNIRMGAAHTLKKLIKAVKSKESTLEIKSALEVLKKDRDIDVINAVTD